MFKEHEDMGKAKALLERKLGELNGWDNFISLWAEKKAGLLDLLGDIKVELPVIGDDSDEEEATEQEHVMPSDMLIEAGFDEKLVNAVNDARMECDCSTCPGYQNDCTIHQSRDWVYGLVNDWECFVSSYPNFKPCRDILGAIVKFSADTLGYDQFVANRGPGGMKYGKWLRKLFRVPEPVMDTILTVVSQVVQGERGGKSSVIVSASPFDFLTMGKGGSWSSCHSLDSSHHPAGPLSYIHDDCTLIAYSPGTGVTHMVNTEIPTKQWRMVIHVDIFNRSAAFGRQYPMIIKPLSKTARRVVNHVLADHHGIARNWVFASRQGHVNGGGLEYSESECGRSTYLKDGGSMPDLSYGSFSLCAICGERSLHTAGSLICRQCTPSIHRNNTGFSSTDHGGVCVSCDEECSSGYLDPDGAFLCEYCYYDSTHSCEECDEVYYTDSDECRYYSEGEVTLCDECFNENYYHCNQCDIVVHSHYATEDNDNVPYCSYCAGEVLFFCDCCNDYHQRDHDDYAYVGEAIYCEYCKERHLFYCDTCNEWAFRDDISVLRNGEELCSDCFLDDAETCMNCDEHDYTCDMHNVGNELRDGYLCDNCYEMEEAI